MYALTTRQNLHGAVWLAAGVVGIGLASGLVAWAGGPLFVPLMAVGILGGALVFMQPMVGLLVMYAVTLLKPEAVQGLGWVNPTNLTAAALAGILFLTVVLGGPTDFLRSNQVRLLLLLGAVLVVNWIVLGRIEPPAHLAEKDFSLRTLARHTTHLAFVTFVVAFVRTPRHLLSLTGVFLLALFLTIPGALGGPGASTKVEALRASAVAGGVHAAENANRLAFICLMGISLIWFALQHYRSWLVRLIGSASLLVLVLTMFRSGSRSGALLFLLLVGLLLLQSGLKLGHIALIILMAFVCVGLVVALVPDAVQDRILSVVFTSSEYQPGSLAESNARRLAVLGAGLKLFMENPIMGIGIGNFRWMTTFDIEHGGISMAAHNAYLLALTEGGVVLLAAYLLLFGVTMRDLSRVLAQSAHLPEVGLRWLILATRINLILLLGFSCFAEGWKEFFYPSILATTGALVVLYGRAAAARKASPA